MHKGGLRRYDLPEVPEGGQRAQDEAEAEHGAGLVEEDVDARGEGDDDYRREVEEHEEDPARNAAPHYGEEADPERGVTQVEKDVRAYLIQELQGTRHLELGRDAHHLQDDIVDDKGNEQAQRVDPLLSGQEPPHPRRDANRFVLYRHEPEEF